MSSSNFNPITNFKSHVGDTTPKRLQGEQKVQQIDDPLMGDTDSCVQLERERPVHRLMAELTAQGYNAVEVAKFTDYDPVYVRRILKQPFVRDRIVKTIKKSVQDEMKEFLEAEVLPSLRTLKTVRDNPTARGTDKISASNALLDRFLGKPVQPIDNNAKPVSELSDEQLKAEVERELAKSQTN